MELQYSFLAITLLPFLLLWLAKQKIKVSRAMVHKQPPGPWKLPLLGNLHQLAMAGSLPHHALRDLAHKYGPLMYLQLGEIHAMVVSSPDMAKEIMKTHDLAFANRQQTLAAQIMFYGNKDIVFAPYGDYWRQMRKVCTLELFSAKRVQSFSYVREDEVAKLIQSIRFSTPKGSPINFSKSVFSLLSALVSRTVWGKKSNYEDEIMPLLQKTMEMVGGFDVADLFPSLKPLHLITRKKAKLEGMRKKLDKILENVINDNQSNHGKDETLIDVLLRVKQSSNLDIPITIENIKAVLWEMFGAGTDSSATVIEWAMSELMKNPRVMEKTQVEIRKAFKGKKIIIETDLQELSYFKLVIKETLRLHPPVPLLLPRECRETSMIGGYEISVNTKVIVNAWALGRDPNLWYDAEKFIPERFHDTSFDFRGNNFEYLPFGAGRRICPGILLGIANVELSLAALLYHFDWELPNSMKPDDLDMIEHFGSTVGRKNSLYLIPTPYDYSLHHDVHVLTY
ncbi:cytochrome P450 71D8-like [Lotus japonicus]|uniref:cytochrome P450 71D8-like n=1 Tax=Lotus japonicus TaxID=34305 RepID=UPI0025867A41|nr:cytochrome P450 71D8-like [Lotus japonicus]